MESVPDAARRRSARWPTRSSARLEGSIRRGADVASSRAPSGDGSWRSSLADGSHASRPTPSICAAHAYTAARLLRRIESSLADRSRLHQLRIGGDGESDLSRRRFPKPPDAFGFVVPAIEQRKIIAGSFSSLKFEGRAPEGFVLARVFLGGVLQSDMMKLSDDEMVAAARDEFRELLGVTAAPGMTEVQRWPAAMPQYAVGHLDRVAKIEEAVARDSGSVSSRARRIAASAFPIACTAARTPPRPRSERLAARS